jgi:phosphate transport system protein
MRQAYHEELNEVAKELVRMAELVGTAIEQATTALLDVNLTLAETVIAGDEKVDIAQRVLDQRAQNLLARQQPVATDLRILITSLRIAADLERMGDLARHIAKLARLRYPSSAIPESVREVVKEMGQVASRMASHMATVLSTRNVTSALELEKEDDQMDRLHQTLFHEMLDGAWHEGVECAVDVALCSRYYERFADHAVSVADRVVFLVTGERSREYTKSGH